MAAVAERKLSLEDFRARYSGEKPYFEYWDGEAVQKSMPTRLHSLIQMILVQMLEAMGYAAGQEITLRLDPAYEPIPDVIAEEGRSRDPYPTEPFEVVIEILSPDDSFSRVLLKCRLYEKWGIRQVVVVDPQAGLVWSFKDGTPRETETIATRGERVITAQELWTEVDRQLPPVSISYGLQLGVAFQDLNA
jgi:Uma2 family endonuclease